MNHFSLPKAGRNLHGILKGDIEDHGQYSSPKVLEVGDRSYGTIQEVYEDGVELAVRVVKEQRIRWAISYVFVTL